MRWSSRCPAITRSPFIYVLVRCCHNLAPYCSPPPPPPPPPPLGTMLLGLGCWHKNSHPPPHSSAGVGRTGTYLTIDVELQRARREKLVNPFSYVTAMRENRNLMVQTEVGLHVPSFATIVTWIAVSKLCLSEL